jgi:D-glycerate 3-kinase
LLVDDFYLTRAQRVAWRPRFIVVDHAAFRGRMTWRCGARYGPAASRSGGLPAFDKGLDERCAEHTWPLADLPIWSFWKAGVSARGRAAAPLAPVNALEQDEDPDGRWRVHQRCLGRAVSDAVCGFDALICLQVPDFDAVRRWRGEQELHRHPRSGWTRRRSERFIRHHERLTRWMLQDLPQRAQGQ